MSSPITIRLPQQLVKIEAHVEPSNRRVIYQWTYKKDGPITPILEVKIDFQNLNSII